jgi:hypothetical protein
MMTIDRFTGDHDFLSNFHSSPIEVDGVVYGVQDDVVKRAESR